MQKNSLQPRTICEIGCGAGEILKQLQSWLPADTALCGYDISPQALEFWRQRANERLQFHCEDLIAAETASFDLLLCIDVFEHVQDYIGFLRELRIKARHKIFHIPLDMSAQWVLRGEPILRERELAGHLHYFMKDTAMAALRDTGYEVLDWTYTPGAIDNPRSIKARLASWPRRLLMNVNQDFTVRVLGGYSLLVLAK
jgi:2-polyprenyl-3-methyl-5-hydroxy-6-metoxy-1,4-benzoquinol methylase